MKKLMEILKKFWLYLKAETPKGWAWLAHISFIVPSLISVINLATAGTIVPLWYANNQFYVIGVFTIIGFFAGSRTTDKGKEQVKNAINSQS